MTNFNQIETETWKEINPSNQPPPPRRAHTSFVYDDKMYIFGGWNGVECFNDMWFYDFGKFDVIFNERREVIRNFFIE